MSARLSAEPRLVWPREHGAWGQFLVPGLAALAMAGPTLPAGLLALGGLAAFGSHEAVLLLLGQRGESLGRRRGAAARRTLLVVAPAAVVCGGLGLWLAPASARLGALLPLALGLALIGVVALGREKTTGGECLAASTAAAAAVPVALAGGAPPAAAVLGWAVWTVAFGAATAGVRLLLGRHTSRHDPVARPVLLAATVAALLGVWRLGPVLLAAAPHLLVAWWLVLRRPHPRHLRRVGWTLVAATVITGAALVISARLG